MIAALLKHEWLRTRSLLGSIGAVAVLLVAAGTALTATGWPGISLVGMLMVMAPLAALVPATQIALAVHYWQSSYSRTGYFTQSLPLSGVTIYAAKLAWALLVSLLAPGDSSVVPADSTVVVVTHRVEAIPDGTPILRLQEHQ